jgi:methyl-accepting chemotaxis protein
VKKMSLAFVCSDDKGLRVSVEDVANSVRTVNEASQQLSLVSTESGEATNQIAATFQQVAKGRPSKQTALPAWLQLWKKRAHYCYGSSRCSRTIPNHSAGYRVMQRLSQTVENTSRSAQPDDRSRNTSSAGRALPVVEEIRQGAQAQASGLEEAVKPAKASQALENMIQASESVSEKVELSSQTAQDGMVL